MRVPEAELVPVDADALRAAMDGRRQEWLARKVGLSQNRISRLLHGGQRVSRVNYAKMRAALPTLPPPPLPAVTTREEAAV